MEVLNHHEYYGGSHKDDRYFSLAWTITVADAGVSCVLALLSVFGLCSLSAREDERLPDCNREKSRKNKKKRNTSRCTGCNIVSFEFLMP